MSNTPDDFGDDLPSPDKTVGTVGHTADHNFLRNELAEVQNVVTQLWEAAPNIRGTVSTTDDLPDPGTLGDLYIVGEGDLFAWNTTTDGWDLVGNLTGPEGPAGADAEIGVLEANTLPPLDSTIGSLWWVADDTVVEPPPPDPLEAEFVGQDSTGIALGGGGVKTISLTIPGTIVSGDFAIMSLTYNGTVTPAVSGWTKHSTITYSSSMKTDIWYKSLTAGGTVTATWTEAFARAGMAVTVFRNVTGILNLDSDLTDATTIPSPTITATEDFVVVAGWGHRSSSAVSQAVTKPASIDAIDSFFGGTGDSGAVSIATGYEITPQAASSTYDPGDWGPDSGVTGHITWIASLGIAV